MGIRNRLGKPNTKTRPQPERKTPDPRTALVRDLTDSGVVVASACGTCGGTVAANDPEAVQETRVQGKYPMHRDVRSWRYHGGACTKARSGPELLAFALDPEFHADGSKLLVTQAHADVARKLGAPLAYRDTVLASHTDRGRPAWRHVPRAELAELRAAVERRHQELTVAVPHRSGLSCQVCGRTHELADAWGLHKGRPACGRCSVFARRSQISGNRALWQMARDVVLTEAAHLLPARALTWPFPLAQDVPSYSRHDCKVPREPWSYVADIPVAPLTEEERNATRLAELERRMAEVPA